MMTKANSFPHFDLFRALIYREFSNDLVRNNYA
jgi:hypothetical protein